METYLTPKEMKVTKSYCFGTFPKTYITGKIGDVVTVIGETKNYYITTNAINNKLPKWVTQ